MHGFSIMRRKATYASAPHNSQSMLMVAARTDGLGGRLLAMVNAKCLADRLGYRFGFTWSSPGIEDTEFHTADSIDKVFSSDFIDRHWLGDKADLSRFRVLGKERFTRSSLAADAGHGDIAGWICDFGVLESLDEGWARRWLPANSPARWKTETFRTLGFSAGVNATFAAADRCRFARPMAALHLRSGDIVRGRFRSTLDFADKVIPSVLAKAIVSKLASKGFATLLVGQDRDTLEYLKAETGAFLADDFGAGDFEDHTLRAFFEMALMARCRKIYAGSSVFATIASVMGDVPFAKTRALFRKRRAARLVLEELKAHEADYHPFEAAFGYRSALLTLEREIGPAGAREILGRAGALDPENDIYALRMAVTYFREKDFLSGEAVLKSLMTRQFQTLSTIPLPMMQTLTGKMWRGHVMERDFELFHAAAKAGNPYAAVCSAYIFHEALRQPKLAMKMADLSLVAEPANAMFRQTKSCISDEETRAIAD